MSNKTEARTNLKTSPSDEPHVISSEVAHLLEQLADPDDEGVDVIGLVRVVEVRGDVPLHGVDHCVP